MLTPWKPFIKDACLAGLITVAGLTLARWGGIAVPVAGRIVPWPAFTVAAAAVFAAIYVLMGPRPAPVLPAAAGVTTSATGQLTLATEPRAAIPANGGSSFLHRIVVANGSDRPAAGVRVAVLFIEGRDGAGLPIHLVRAGGGDSPAFTLAPGQRVALDAILEQYSAGRGPRNHPHLFQSVERPAIFFERATSPYAFTLALSSADQSAPSRYRAEMTWSDLLISWRLTLSSLPA